MPEGGILCFKSALHLNGKANRVRKKHNSMTIAADVKQFCYQINTDGVFGTHRGLPRIATARPAWREVVTMIRGDWMAGLRLLTFW